MKLIFFPNLMSYCYQILCFACLIIWKHKNKFHLFLQKAYDFFPSEILCCVLQFLRHKILILFIF